MAKKSKFVPLDAPLLHADHPRPKTRRDFLRQGFATGVGSIVAPSMLSLLPTNVRAALTEAETGACNIGAGQGLMPFICFDLAGGANFAASNVVVGRQGGQEDAFNEAGYLRMGIGGDMLGVDSIDDTLGLRFHSQSPMLQGILEKFTSVATTGSTDGVYIPARSDNDTANNPHNPMYAIARTGASGNIMTLIGSRNSDSGGNSMAPMDLINLEIRPTKIDRASDARGIVDTGKLFELMDAATAQKVIESMYRLSQQKSQIITGVNTIPIPPETGSLSNDEIIKRALDCGYMKAVNNAGFSPETLDPEGDEIIASIFPDNEIRDGEFNKTSSVMKLVIDGYAGAGCITMGGYDYHTGERTTGDARDLRAGRCIGACLEYAARRNSPLAIYVFSDGSVFSNGMIDGANGRPVWTGDNSSTAGSFMLVFHPEQNTTILRTPDQRQLGYYNMNGAVETSSSVCADNVNALVETVALNYLALHDRVGEFATHFPNHRIGSTASIDSHTMFSPIHIVND